MSREQPQFAVVDQAIGTMRQIKEYINVGMETTIDVAMDVVENDKGNEKQLDDLKSVMLEYVDMERDLEQFLAAVDYTKEMAQSSGDMENMEAYLEEKLAELQRRNRSDDLKEHEKYQDLQQKIHELQNPDAVAGPSMEDEDVCMTQESLNTKCPYTAQEMKNPVQNKNCKHNYDKEGIMEYIKVRGKKAKCPVSGCANVFCCRCPVSGCANVKPIELADLEDNRELRRYIERQNRQTGKRTKR